MSDFDTIVYVFTGTSLLSLNLVKGDDDSDGEDGESRVTFFATSGVDYKIAVHGFDEGLGERHRGQLDGKAAGLPHAPLHVLGALAKMRVTAVDLAPGIDDPEDGLAGVVDVVEAHLLGARPVSECTHVLHAIPAVASQICRLFFAHDSMRSFTVWLTKIRASSLAALAACGSSLAGWREP